MKFIGHCDSVLEIVFKTVLRFLSLCFGCDADP